MSIHARDVHPIEFTSWEKIGLAAGLAMIVAGAYLLWGLGAVLLVGGAGLVLFSAIGDA